MPANPEPRRDPRDSYYYRRRLSGRELVPAVAVGLLAGLAAFYLARVFAQRTRLRDAARPPRRPRNAGVEG